MRLVKLFVHFVTLSIKRESMHRTNLAADFLMTLFGLASGLLTIGAIYSQIHSLAGWSFEEALILQGTFQLLSGLLGAFVTPNLSFFREKVVSGTIDDYLLRPVPSLFTASLGSCSPLALLQTLPGIALIVVGAARTEIPASLANWFLYIVCQVSGLVIAWAFRVLLASISFWAPGTEPSVLFDAFWELGRFPVAVYHPRVRQLLTAVVPVAFIGSIPASVLTGGSTPLWGLISAVFSAAAFMAACMVWSIALRRYTSISS